MVLVGLVLQCNPSFYRQQVADFVGVWDRRFEHYWRAGMSLPLMHLILVYQGLHPILVLIKR